MSLPTYEAIKEVSTLRRCHCDPICEECFNGAKAIDAANHLVKVAESADSRVLDRVRVILTMSLPGGI